jgi:hypothetical protein
MLVACTLNAALCTAPSQTGKVEKVPLATSLPEAWLNVTVSWPKLEEDSGKGPQLYVTKTLATIRSTDFSTVSPTMMLALKAAVCARLVSGNVVINKTARATIFFLILSPTTISCWELCVANDVCVAMLLRACAKRLKPVTRMWREVSDLSIQLKHVAQS